MPRKFKRAIIAVSALNIAFCLIVPKVIGTGVREAITDQALNQLAIATGGQINISRSKLESRWFNSSAEFIIDSPLIHTCIMHTGIGDRLIQPADHQNLSLLLGQRTYISTSSNI